MQNSVLTGGAIALRSVTAIGQTTPGLISSPKISEPEIPDSTTLRQQFQSPLKKYRPIARWWWPGNDVTGPELRREIQVLDEAGFAGAEIQSFFKGLDARNFSKDQMKRIDSFASSSFFGHVGIAADEAHKRGMFIDYTFGSGWPFGGGAAITPELASIELRSTHLSVEGPAKLHQQMQIPSITDGDPLNGLDNLKGLPEGWVERMKRRTRIVAVIAVRGENAQWDFHATGGPRQTVSRTGQLQRGASINLTSHLSPEGFLTWDAPPGIWQLFVFCSVPTGQRVNGAAGEGPQLVMDHLNAEAFRAHAKRVGDAALPYLGSYFGSGLRAVFCDSLEVAANLFWSDDFLAEFHHRRGYDLLPYLPILKVQSYAEPYGNYADLPIFDMPEIGDQVRNDYRQTVSDLMAERFYGEFNQWAHKHGLLSRTQAHGSPTDILRIYGEADIPETETLYGKGGYDFLKLAASAANVYGRAIVGSESFVWPGAAYQTTPEKMKIAADELFTAGVNAIVFHGSPYLIPEIPAPGWHPFSGINHSGNYSSQFNELNPFWKQLAKLNRYITRVQFISQVGKTIAPVALYRNDLAHGADEMPPAPKLNQALMDAGYNYDHINSESLLRCTIREKRLISAGEASYKVLVLTATKAIDAVLAEKLDNFARSGLPIVFAGQIPSCADGLTGFARQTERVQDAMRNLSRYQNVFATSHIDNTLSALRRAASPNIRFHGRALSFIQKSIGAISLFFLRNPSDSPQHLQAEFEAEGAPELWDPWTGEITAINSYRRNGEWIEVNHDLQPFASALIVFHEYAVPQHARADLSTRTPKRREEIGVAGWKLVVTGLDPSGKLSVIHRNLPLLIDWSLDSELRGISGRGIYTTTFAVSDADAGSHFVLDLGCVKDVAEVTVNGKPAGSLLLRPYQADITGLVVSGENVLEVTVTNALFNCLVQRQPPVFRAGPTENPSGLMSAGLVGPVELRVLG